MKWFLGLFKGPINWLVGLLIDKLIKGLIDWIKQLVHDYQEKKKDKQLEENYDQVVKDPDASQDDRKNATDDFLNRRP